MNRARLSAVAGPWVLAGLVLLAVLPRFVTLSRRPVMHDEGMFAYYAFTASRNLERARDDPDFTGPYYTHMPILHGPTLILATGALFYLLDDSMAVARGFIAVCSLAALAAACALGPRRLRPWLALLLCTSPTLLYYSRFFRNDMLFSCLALIGLLGVVRSLAATRGRALWGALGMACLVALLAVKENALFLHAAGLTFGAAWWAVRYRSRLAESLRRWMPASVVSGVLPARRKRHRRRSRGSPAEAGTPPVAARLPARGWVAGLALGLLWVGWIYASTPGAGAYQSWERQLARRPELARDVVFQTAKPLYAMGRNLAVTWSYWEQQHSIQRIRGEIHYHLPILLTYELPLLVLLAAGLTHDAWRPRRRWAYGAGLAVWALLWTAWRMVGSMPPGVRRIVEFLHLEPDGSLFVLGVSVTALLTWSILELFERRWLPAWMGWWAACSLFQYSVAGEKVPWLAVHIALPLYLAAAWLWTPAVDEMGRRGRLLVASVVILGAALALRNDVALIGERAADPRERLVYNHTTREFHELCEGELARWRRAERGGIPLAERVVVLQGEPSWPGYWYFRRCRYLGRSAVSAPALREADLVLGNKSDVEGVLPDLDRTAWRVEEVPLRRAWLHPPPPDGSRWAAWWRYFWRREVWDWPDQAGGDQAPVLALAPAIPQEFAIRSELAAGPQP